MALNMLCDSGANEGLGAEARLNISQAITLHAYQREG